MGFVEICFHVVYGYGDNHFQSVDTFVNEFFRKLNKVFAKFLVKLVLVFNDKLL